MKLTHMETVRILSGIFNDNLDETSTRLALCNLVARNYLGLADDAYTDESLSALGIQLKRNVEGGTDDTAQH
jgi:hypothetical protein